MTKRDKENYAVTQYIKKLSQEGYDYDRAIAASLDMLRRGTLPMVSPPKLSTGQKQQQKQMTTPRKKVVSNNRKNARSIR